MPLPKGFREWLAKESEGWSVDGLISPDQRDRILGRYPEEETSTGRMAFVLRAFGVLLFGAAVMLVVGHNWADLPRGGKLATVVAGVALLQGVGLWYTFNARRTGSVLGHLAGCLMFGAGIALVGQTYHMDAHSPDALLAWCLGTLPFALVLESALLHVATLALAATWILMEQHGGWSGVTGYDNWTRIAYLILLLPSAAAAYRGRMPIIAGAVAWALIPCWLFFPWSVAGAALPLALSALHPSGSPYARGFRFIGALGVTGVTLYVGMLSRGNVGTRLGLFEDPVLLALGVIAAGWALGVGIRDKDASRTWPAMIALGTLALGIPREVEMRSELVHAVLKAAANLLTIATAVWLVRTGLGEGRLRPYVYGSLVFLAWLTARYVNIAEDFGMLGTAGFFATIGVILFGRARVWKSQKDGSGAVVTTDWSPTWLERPFAFLSAKARPIALVCALLQAGGLLWMAWHHGRPAETGERFLLRCRALDPRDLMKGDYVILGYEFSNPTQDDISRLNNEWSALNGGESGTSNQVPYWNLPDDTEVFLPLKVDAKGVAGAGAPTLNRPASGPYLRGHAGSRRFGLVRFGIEAFYVEEGKGKEWEKLRNEGRLVAEIGVLPDGRAGLVGLRKADASMVEAEPFHRLEQHFYSGRQNYWGYCQVVSTKKEFDQTLSPARVSGPPPRMPDFSKEVVAILTEPETDHEVKLDVKSVERFGRSLMIRYRITRGAKMTHRARPMEAVIVTRGEATEVIFTEEGGEGRVHRMPLR
ncbi:MAG: GDYXXLXY domain-containing protein [Opitutales bacterium]